VGLYEIEDLRFRYPGRFRLEIDEFHLAAGEKVSIIGRNGSGKTTLLRLLAFLERPQFCSRFVYRGRAVRNGSADRANMGFLKQQPWIFNNSVADNLAFSLKVRRAGQGGIRAGVEAMAERVGLRGQLKAPARSLSGGEQKRLALGRVLIAEPDLLLLDEPMAHLDGNSQEIIEALLRSCSAAMLFTTHDLRLASSLADRTCTLKEGRISAELPVNIFEGGFEEGVFVSRGGLRIEVMHPPETASTRAAIDPQAIVISPRPLQSSMRNCFPGSIESVQADKDRVWLEIDAGERFTAIVSRRSYEEIGLNLHSMVFISFKSAAVSFV
jgi:molybdopterin-binding protein